MLGFDDQNCTFICDYRSASKLGIKQREKWGFQQNNEDKEAL